MQLLDLHNREYYIKRSNIIGNHCTVVVLYCVPACSTHHYDIVEPLQNDSENNQHDSTTTTIIELK